MRAPWIGLSIVIAVGLAHGQATWAPPCPHESKDVLLHSAVRCVGGAMLHTRGYLRGEPWVDRYGTMPVCALVPPVPGQIYTNAWFCGGRGSGVEAIQQSRVIGQLGWIPGGIHPRVQWEVMVKDGTDRGWADVVFYDRDLANVMQVWELKRESDAGGWDSQVDGYVAKLAEATAGKVLVQRGTLLAGWVDEWLIEDTRRAQPNCAKTPFRVMVGWQAVPGQFLVYEYQACFDPVNEPIPVPKDLPVHLPKPAPDRRAVPLPGRPYPAVPALPREQVPAEGDDYWTVKCGHGWFAQCDFGPFRFPFPGYHGTTFGHPHLGTFDGLKYDLQVVGEFELATSQRHGVAVQARFVPVRSSRIVSALGAIAFTLGGHVVELRLGGAPGAQLLLDREPYALRDGMMIDLGGGAVIVRARGHYLAVWPGTGERAALVVAPDTRLAQLSLPRDPAAVGLLGSADDAAGNDLRTGFGEPMPANPSPVAMHRAFADSWRIDDEHSLFTYGPGESTATFTDRTFPDSFVAVGDLGAAERDAATRQCAAAGVIDGPQFDDCVLDAALTLDASFVAGAAQVTRPLTVAGAAKLDASGAIVQTFEGAVAPNFDAERFGRDAQLGTFAGPFGKDDRYRFFVADVPRHDRVTIELDLIAIGDAASGAAPAFALRVNAREVWSGTLAGRTPAATGQLATGQRYAVHRVTATFPHGLPAINAGVFATGLSGAAGQAFAVDNVRIATHLVPAQAFAVTLPAAIAPGAPGPGAGTLESLGAQDRYDVTLAAPGELVLRFADCTASMRLRWTVAGANGATAARGSGCAVAITPSLAAGAWTVIVDAEEAGTYTVELAARARPQTFELALPATIAAGAPGAGAGALESPGAEDRFAFGLDAPARLQLDAGGCSRGLISLTWSVVGPGRTVVATGRVGCGSSIVTPVIPAGRWCLFVGNARQHGTYTLAVSTEARPQTFAVALPAAIADGVPAAGAGNLETTSSRDAYDFTLAAPARVQLDFARCSRALVSVKWAIVRDDGTTVASGRSCTTARTPALPAGAYRLEVDDRGRTGTYTLALSALPPA